MKKILLLTFIALTYSLNAQGNVHKQRQVDLSVKISEYINTIKKNEFFSFIGKPPEKMIEMYDCNDILEYYTIKGTDYSIEVRSNNVVINHGGNKFHLTMINTDFVGYGCTLDTRAKKMTTYYFQNDKIVKKSVKEYSL